MNNFQFSKEGPKRRSQVSTEDLQHKSSVIKFSNIFWQLSIVLQSSLPPQHKMFVVLKAINL